MRKILDVAVSYFKGMNWRGWVQLVIIIILAIALVKGCKREKEYEDRIEQLTKVKPSPKTATTVQAEVIAQKVNREGQALTTFKEAEPIIKMIEDKTKADSLAKVAEVERSKVTAITVINGTLSKENLDLKRQISMLANGTMDTAWRYKDRWLSFDVIRPNDTITTVRNFTADASINKVDFDRKRYWLFGQNENLATVWFESPYVKVDGMETLKIKRKEPLVDVKLYLEGKYLHNQKEALLGPKVRLNIGRLGINGGYYLNPNGTIGNGPWYGLDWKIY